MEPASVLGNPVLVGAGLTLLHFLWQGALVTALLWALLHIIERKQAQLRYAISVACLALMAALPLLTGTYLFQVTLRQPAEAPGVGSATAATAGASTESAVHNASLEAVALHHPVSVMQGAELRDSPANRARERSRALTNGNILAPGIVG